MDFIRQFLVVHTKQLNGLLQRLEHLIRDGLSVFHGHQMSHAFHQAVVVAFIHLLCETAVRHLDELRQVMQTMNSECI